MPNLPQQPVVTPLRHAAQRKRSKRNKVLTVLLSILLILVAGAVVLDNWARTQVADFVVAKIQQTFNLDKNQPVSVEVAGFSVLGQLATGSLEQVSADVENVAVGELRGGVRLTMTNVPLDERKPVGRLQGEFRMSESTVKTLVTSLSAATVTQVQLSAPEILLGGDYTTPSITVFGVTIPPIPIALSIGLQPFAENGKLGFTPTSVEINGVSSTAEEMTAKYGTVAASVLQPQSVCVAGWLPQAFTVDNARVRGKELVASFSAKNQILSASALGALGSCT